ncbi:MAG: polysaccharide deacetylase family protein [Eubacteriales bacterium]|nr:polysaccharide deacetylase family protein [Eubacteriales bacterium]
MDKRIIQERMRQKKRQMVIRKYTRLATYAIAAVLVVIFVVKGVIFPIMNRGDGEKNKKSQGETIEVQAQTAEADPNAAIRQPLKGKGDASKVSVMTPGWHESEEGRWYQNADGTYYANGFQEIDGAEYSFDENGYMQTGWVTKGVNDYFFNEDGTYNKEKKRPMLALTFDDGPSEYTDELLDCLEKNNAKATFFMLGQNVELYPDAVKRMQEMGCDIGSHSWDHLDLMTLDENGIAEEFSKTDEALIKACGQPASVARAPYGSADQHVYDIVQKPFFMWSLDTLDWKLLDAQADYDAVMNGDLTDGSIILMHDIHEPSVQAALKLIPDLVAKGYKLVTVSEMAEAKGVELQNARYIDFWQSSFDNGSVPGYKGGNDSLTGGSDDAVSDGSEGTGEDGADGAVSDGSEDGTDESAGGDGSEDEMSDGSSGEEV